MITLADIKDDARELRKFVLPPGVRDFIDRIGEAVEDQPTRVDRFLIVIGRAAVNHWLETGTCPMCDNLEDDTHDPECPIEGWSRLTASEQNEVRR